MSDKPVKYSERVEIKEAISPQTRDCKAELYDI
jgi:hypothetical protein